MKIKTAYVGVTREILRSWGSKAEGGDTQSQGTREKRPLSAEGQVEEGESLLGKPENHPIFTGHLKRPLLEDQRRG